MNPNKFKRLFPNASRSVTNLNVSLDGIRSTKQELTKGMPLEHTIQREEESRLRCKIIFTIYSTRPLDFDNYWTKCSQDCLREAGIIHDDAWDVLEGTIRSRKAHSKEEERTEIQIIRPCNENIL